MTIPLLTIVRQKNKDSGLSMEVFYSKFRISRQAYFQGLRRLESLGEMMLEIKDQVKKYRSNHDRRAGSRSLYYNLEIKTTYNIGVTKFEKLMSSHGLTLAPLRIRVVTTKSSFQSWNYKNLCNGLVISRINQLVVGDITYISIGKYRYYLFCLIDVFSLRIVGYHISKRMRKEEAILALEMAINLRGRKNLSSCIHHTDGGGQYFAKKYLMALGQMKSSVAKTCLENGFAEQKNGYIKNHLIPTISLSKLDELEREVVKVMHFYNNKRKQRQLGWKTPVEFENHLQNTSENLFVKLHDFEQNIPAQTKRF